MQAVRMAIKRCRPVGTANMIKRRATGKQLKMHKANVINIYACTQRETRNEIALKCELRAEGGKFPLHAFRRRLLKLCSGVA